MHEQARRLIVRAVGLIALACLTLAAAPPPVPPARVHSQHVTVTASAQVVHSCHASFHESSGKLHVDADCKSSDDGGSTHFSSDDRDNRRIFRIENDDGVTVVQF